MPVVLVIYTYFARETLDMGDTTPATAGTPMSDSTRNIGKPASLHRRRIEIIIAVGKIKQNDEYRA